MIHSVNKKLILPSKRGLRDPIDYVNGKVEIFVHHHGTLVDYIVAKNIILFQGQAELLRAVCITSPTTTPRVITRMAVGDQGTIPSDSTVPKIAVKTATGLFHEIARQDINSNVPTFYTPVGFTYTGNTTLNSDPVIGATLTNMSSIAGVTAGMVVTGTGIPLGSIVVSIPTSNSVLISNPVTSSNTGTSITFAGSVNECQFLAQFNAVDIPLTSYANPSQPRLNEVSLVIIDPTAAGGLTRPSVYAPNAPNTDEVVLSLRTFNSVPFLIAQAASVTIKYTIYTQ